MATLKAVSNRASMAGSSSQSSGTAVTQGDCFTFWPVVIPIATGVVVASAVLFSSMLSILAPSLGMLVICGWLMCMFVAIGVAGIRRAWRRFASLLAILAVAVFATPPTLLTGDYVHFLIALPYYASRINSSDAEPGRIYFHWPSAGLVPSYERNLVYDPSDELAAHAGKVEPLQAQPGGRRIVRHFLGHFYLVEDDF